MKRIFIFLLVLSLSGLNSVFAAETRTDSRDPKDFKNGMKVTLEILKELPLVDDPAKTKRLSEIGYRVAQRAAPEMPHFSFRLVKMEEPNAFALPGGFIFVTSGMMDLDLTDEELAALLGHEIIHVRNEHSRKMSKRQTIMNLLYSAVLAGLAIGLKEGKTARDPITGYPTRNTKADVLQGTAAFGLIFQELLLRGFNRELELESDHEGMIASSRAGFSPAGTSSLFEKMRRKIYEAPGYGYWRTHPYLEDRMEAARVLASTFDAAKNPASAEDYRRETQKLFMAQLNKLKEEQERLELRRMALGAYRTGPIAEELRWWFVRNAETEELKREPFARDYGKVIRVYEENIEELKNEKTTTPAFLEKLEKNVATLNKENLDIKTLYHEVFAKKNYDTEMLKRYLSNYANDPRVYEVRYHLAENYRILKKQKDAASLYLEVIEAEAPQEWKEKSIASLQQLIPNLDDLSACYKLATQTKNPALQTLAKERMVTLAAGFESLENGYEFRRSYPGSQFDKPVIVHMTKLASNTLNQSKLYQAVGEYQKALDGYNKILRFCSDLPIADQVKDTIVDFQELQKTT